MLELLPGLGGCLVDANAANGQQDRRLLLLLGTAVQAAATAAAVQAVAAVMAARQLGKLGSLTR